MTAANVNAPSDEPRPVRPPKRKQEYARELSGTWVQTFTKEELLAAREGDSVHVVRRDGESGQDAA